MTTEVIVVRRGYGHVAENTETGWRLIGYQPIVVQGSYTVTATIPGFKIVLVGDRHVAIPTSLVTS